MITLHQLDLNNELRAYMDKCLKTGNAMSRRAAEKIKFEDGQIYAALPQDFDLSRLPRHEHGGVAALKGLGPQRLKVENEEYLLLLVAEIKDYLRGAGKIVIFEDALRKPDDLFIRNNPDRLSIVAANQEIYYCLTPEDKVADDKILSTVKRASAVNRMEYVGFFAHTSSTPDSLKQLEALADTISAIVFGAFDRESYLLWRK